MVKIYAQLLKKTQPFSHTTEALLL